MALCVTMGSSQNRTSCTQITSAIHPQTVLFLYSQSKNDMYKALLNDEISIHSGYPRPSHYRFLHAITISSLVLLAAQASALVIGILLVSGPCQVRPVPKLEHMLVANNTEFYSVESYLLCLPQSCEMLVSAPTAPRRSSSFLHRI